MIEQAAAEALVSVSRVQQRASGEDSGAGDDESEEEDEPRGKRVEHGASGNTAAPLTRRRSVRTRVSTREPSPENDAEDADGGSKGRRKRSQRSILLAESRSGSLSSSSRAAFRVDGAALPIHYPFIWLFSGPFRFASAESLLLLPLR